MKIARGEEALINLNSNKQKIRAIETTAYRPGIDIIVNFVSVFVDVVGHFRLKHIVINSDESNENYIYFIFH